MTTLYKVFTHDLRPPVQGGDPVFDGTLPFILPARTVDESANNCGAGWNACRKPETALRIAGLWPNGRPSRLFRVDVDGKVIERGDKCRFETGTVAEELDPTDAIRVLHAPFGVLQDEIVVEVVAWRSALTRPGYDKATVEAGLRVALDTRGLMDWTIREYPVARAARDAWDAGYAWANRDARAAWDAWAARAARDAWDAWAAWDARAARAARDARAARAARDAWDAWDAWAAWDARAALDVWYAARMGWRMKGGSDYLTVGIRDAYAAGLEIAFPVADKVLGFAMKEAPR